MPIKQLICVLSLGLLLLGWGCVAPEGPMASSPNVRYDYERQPLHPDVSAFHRTDDTTDVLIAVPAKDLLYAKDSESGAFEAKVALRLLRPTSTTLDTLNVMRSVTYREDMPPTVLFTVPVPQAPGTEGRVHVRMTDLRRDRSASSSVTIDKQSTQNHQNFRIDVDGQPVTGSAVPEGSTISVWCPRCEGESLQLLQRKDAARLPPPPFSYNNFTPRSFGPEHLLLEPYFSEDKRMEFDVLEGTYLFTTQSAWDQGRVLLTTQGLFPEITTADGMAESVRYVTSRAEYEEITGRNTRQKVEEFWVRCASDREKARELIRIYYGRVREANAYFTEAVPGWKTDRGLVHIVFGNPQKMNVEPSGETWIYGEEDNLNALVFRFNRAPSGQTDNRYILERNEQLVKVRWERAVTSWRNGRIYAE